jgi:formate/nitrite transporter FocA (FNT family)
MKRDIKTLILAFLSGVAISIGGCVFLACESKYMGALAFSVGLFFTVEFGFKLYTGAVGYALDNTKQDNFSLITILVGNFLGALFIGLILQLSRFEVGLQEKAKALSRIFFFPKKQARLAIALS